MAIVASASAAASTDSSSSSTVGAHKRFIHGLIEQSRERVVQVRAGQSLVHVLEQTPNDVAQRLPPPPLSLAKTLRPAHRASHERHKLKARNDSALPLLAPPMSLVYAARRQVGAAVKSTEQQSDASAMRRHLRRRGVLESVAIAAAHGPSESLLLPSISANSSSSSSVGRHASVLSSSVSAAKFRAYADSKSFRVETLRQNDRRKAIARSTKTMQQLAALTQQQPHEPATSTATTSLASTLAAMKGKKALLDALVKKDAVSSLTALDGAHITNPHFAFLNFKRASDESSSTLARRANGVDESNAATHSPIHFGDHVCFISEASDLPLSIGRDGRTCAVATLSTGPHMMFTIVDFRDPSRHGVVSTADDFWLRVDASLVHRHAAVDRDALDDETDVSHLLSETHYYVGCAGAIEDAPTTHNTVHKNSTNKEPSARGPALNYKLPTLAGPSMVSSQGKTHSSNNSNSSQSHDTFRLVAIQATVPSAAYYGDDIATREYTIETNESAMRLAHWRFTHVAAATDMFSDANDTEPRQLLNCASVYLSLNHLVLESDAARQHRGVLRDNTTAVRHHRLPHESTATWQVRLLRRGKRTPASSAAVAASSPEPSPSRSLSRRDESAAAAAEWLKTKRENVARTASRTRSKRTLARTSRQSYERVAAQSNAKLVEIEQHKARHQRAYFEARYHTIFEHERDEDDSDSDSDS